MKRASISAGVNVVLIIVGTVSTCKGGLVYDNGAPNGINGFEITSWITISDFALSQPTLLTDVRFWAGTQSGYPEGYQGSIVWSIYGDNSSQPGALLYRDSAVPVRTYDHASWWGNVYRHDFSFASLYLDPGTYWLGLHNGPLSFPGYGSSPFYWESANSNGTLPLYMESAPFDSGVWITYSEEPAFQLSGSPTVVPVPGAAVLGAIGLSFAGWRLRRQAV
jgi:hypothetical protein